MKHALTHFQLLYTNRILQTRDLAKKEI